MSNDGTKGDGTTVLDRSRSLVFVERRQQARCLVRAPSDFLTQLIACEQRLGPFRRARRVEPGAAVACYGPQPSGPRSSFVRSL